MCLGPTGRTACESRGGDGECLALPQREIGTQADAEADAEAEADAAADAATFSWPRRQQTNCRRASLLCMKPFPPRTHFKSHTLPLTQRSRSNQCRRSGLGETRRKRSRKKETKKRESSVRRLCARMQPKRQTKRRAETRRRAVASLDRLAREQLPANRSAACVSSWSVCSQRCKYMMRRRCSIPSGLKERERGSYQVDDVRCRGLN